MLSKSKASGTADGVVTKLIDILLVLNYLPFINC